MVVPGTTEGANIVYIPNGELCCIMQNVVRQALQRGWCIFLSKWHYPELKFTELSDKGSFGTALWFTGT